MKILFEFNLLEKIKKKIREYILDYIFKIVIDIIFTQCDNIAAVQRIHESILYIHPSV